MTRFKQLTVEVDKESIPIGYVFDRVGTVKKGEQYIDDNMAVSVAESDMMEIRTILKPSSVGPPEGYIEADSGCVGPYDLLFDSLSGQWGIAPGDVTKWDGNRVHHNGGSKDFVFTRWARRKPDVKAGEFVRDRTGEHSIGKVYAVNGRFAFAKKVGGGKLQLFHGGYDVVERHLKPWTFFDAVKFIADGGKIFSETAEDGIAKISWVDQDCIGFDEKKAYTTVSFEDLVKRTDLNGDPCCNATYAFAFGEGGDA